MGLLRKLKSVLGMTSGDDERERADVAVTVEREGTLEEPAAETGPTGTTVEADASTGEAADTTGDAVTEVKGIGPSYAGSLGEAGVETVAQLAASDPETLADETGISEKRISRWVQRAERRQ